MTGFQSLLHQVYLQSNVEVFLHIYVFHPTFFPEIIRVYYYDAVPENSEKQSKIYEIYFGGSNLYQDLGIDGEP